MLVVIFSLRSVPAADGSCVCDAVSVVFHGQVRSDVSVFEFNIRFIGGLLSAYGLSRDKVSQSVY